MELGSPERIRGITRGFCELTLEAHDPARLADFSVTRAGATCTLRMYGQFAVNPAVAKIDDERGRGKVVNAAWNGYNAINAISLGSVALR